MANPDVGKSQKFDNMTIVGDVDSGCYQCGKPFLWLSMQSPENTIVLPKSILDCFCLCHLNEKVTSA